MKDEVKRKREKFYNGETVQAMKTEMSDCIVRVLKDIEFFFSCSMAWDRMAFGSEREKENNARK